MRHSHQQTTASLSLTPAIAGYDQPKSTSAAFHGPTHGSAIGASQPLDHGPRLWNSLPARIRQPDNDIGEFRRQLKSFLASRPY